MATPRELFDFCWIRPWRKALFRVFAVFLTLVLNLLWNNRNCCGTIGPQG